MQLADAMYAIIIAFFAGIIYCHILFNNQVLNAVSLICHFQYNHVLYAGTRSWPLDSLMPLAIRLPCSREGYNSP